MSDFTPSRQLIAFAKYARERAEWPQSDRPLPICSGKHPSHATCSGNLCGCECHRPTDAERALFAQLADEIDSYVYAPADPEQDDLFGGV